MTLEVAEDGKLHFSNIRTCPSPPLFINSKHTHTITAQLYTKTKNVPKVVVKIILRALSIACGQALVTSKAIKISRRQGLVITLIKRATAFIQTVPLHVKPHIRPLIRIGELQAARNFLRRVLPDLVGVGDGFDVHGCRSGGEEDGAEVGEGGEEAGHGCGGGGGAWGWWRKGGR